MTPRSSSRQSGVVLLFALLVLVLMTIAVFALIRSSVTGNLIAGNIAFEEGATASAERGVEIAVRWLQRNDGSPALFNDDAAGPVRYSAVRQDPAPGQAWPAFWENLRGAHLVNTVLWTPGDPDGPSAANPESKNHVEYVIQRLCTAQGAPASGAGCERSPLRQGGDGSSKGAGVVSLLPIQQVYYRITVRAAGPRNAVSFIQVVVAQ